MAVQQAQLTAADGAANDTFGYSVAISGDTALVGALYDRVGTTTNQGSVYVFIRTGSSWSQQAHLTAADGAANDNFGSAVAIDGDTALVGASNDDVGSHTDQGSAYVFTRTGSTWSQQAHLTAADGAAHDHGGCRVSLSGDTALVGALGDANGIRTFQGSACVFTRTGTTWTQQAKLTADDGTTGDYFGYSVAVSDDTAVIGAPYDDVGSKPNEGSAYVFVRSGDSWTQQKHLIAADGTPNDYFGSSVAVSDDTVLVGAPHDSVGSHAFQGSAYVFVRSSSSWAQQARLTASDGAAGDWFASLVAIDGDTVLLGAPHDAIGSHANQGSAYVFTRSGSSWYQQEKLTATGGAAQDGLGWSVGLSGETAVVGAPYDDAVTKANQGSAHVFPAVKIDTEKPTAHAIKNITVKRGEKASLPFKITDPAPSSGSARVTITIKLKTKTVKTITIAGVPTNKTTDYSFQMSLKKGSYTWTVRATDLAGNVGSTSATKKLIVT